jgi:hypothetical protein
LISSNEIVKSPTSVDDVPTSVLEPAVLARTCKRSGNALPATVRVKNVNCEPFVIVTTGVNSQSFSVAKSAPLL